MFRFAFLICGKCLWFLIGVVLLLHVLGEHHQQLLWRCLWRSAVAQFGGY